jgi:hypothetical protein
MNKLRALCVADILSLRTVAAEGSVELLETDDSMVYPRKHEVGQTWKLQERDKK